MNPWGADVIRIYLAERERWRFVGSGVKVLGLTVDPRRVRAGLSAVGETGIPGVTVECVDIGKNTNGEGRSLGRY